MPNLFMIDIERTEVSDFEKTILEHSNVGSVVLFARNFKNGEQLKKLVSVIKSIRPDIFIAVDHEGGTVQRFQRFGFRALPSARLYGEVYDLNRNTGIQLARKYGKIMANDLISHGIDLSLAPVIDLHGESEIIAQLDRAFHHDPESVEVLAEAFIDGMNEAGMPSVCKHFPGHGSCLADSHTVTPVYEASEEKLRQADLKPFKGLIEKQKVDAIMPAYVIYKAIDAENSAGFSKIWLQTILRSELGFQGLILSDCLGMKGADIGDLKTRAQQALNAGCDMLILCNQPRNVLYQLLQEIDCELNNESAERLSVFKQKMVGLSDPMASKTVIGSSLSLTFMAVEVKAEPDIISDDINRTKTI